MGTNLLNWSLEVDAMPKKYAREPPVKKNAVKAKGTDLIVSFKNTYNTARAVRNMTLHDAKAYLNACLERQRCIPMRKYCGSQGRHAQAKEFGLTKGRWPTKSIKVVMGLVENMIANATTKTLDAQDLVINHVQINKAPNGRRRTYRAHGRITPFMSHPCHVEMWAQAKEAGVAKAKPSTSGLSLVKQARSRAQGRLREGERK